MDLSMWRHRSRIVAYIDLVLSSLGLIFSLIVIVIGLTATAVIVDEKNKQDAKNIPDSDITAILWVLWVSLAIMILVIAIDLWAAVMLLKATKIGADPNQALHRAKIWRNVNIAFLIFSVVFYAFISRSYFSLIVELVFRGILLYIVVKFIEDLKQYTGLSSGGGPDSVIVK